MTDMGKDEKRAMLAGMSEASLLKDQFGEIKDSIANFQGIGANINVKNLDDMCVNPEAYENALMMMEAATTCASEAKKEKLSEFIDELREWLLRICIDPGLRTQKLNNRLITLIALIRGAYANCGADHVGFVYTQTFGNIQQHVMTHIVPVDAKVMASYNAKREQNALPPDSTEHKKEDSI
jgi:hypothetical protein